jgi:hypothetical protein
LCAQNNDDISESLCEKISEPYRHRHQPYNR